MAERHTYQGRNHHRRGCAPVDFPVNRLEQVHARNKIHHQDFRHDAIGRKKQGQNREDKRGATETGESTDQSGAERDDGYNCHAWLAA